MPATRSSTPSYRLHKPSGQAVVTLNGRDHYLGEHGSKVSRIRYDRLIAEWLAHGRRLPSDSASASLLVEELILAYWEHCGAQPYHRATLQGTIKPALRRLNKLYAELPIGEFGPRQLKTLRESMIDEDLSRGYVNTQIRWMKACVRWGVEEGLVEPSVLAGLDAVRGLRMGRSRARETEPVRPVDDAVVEATLPHLPEVVADMVRVQRLTGMRPGELCGLTTGQIDTSGEVWVATLRKHKTSHHGHERSIPIGPRAQAILGRYLRPELDARLFSPEESEAKRRKVLRAANKTPFTPSRRARDRKRQRRPQRRLNDRYTTGAYASAIARAARRAGQPHWTPNQLRHSRATELRKAFGLDGAGAILGHARLETTQIYAERNRELATRIAAQTG